MGHRRLLSARPSLWHHPLLKTAIAAVRKPQGDRRDAQGTDIAKSLGRVGCSRSLSLAGRSTFWARPSEAAVQMIHSKASKLFIAAMIHVSSTRLPNRVTKAQPEGHLREKMAQRTLVASARQAFRDVAANFRSGWLLAAKSAFRAGGSVIGMMALPPHAGKFSDAGAERTICRRMY